MEYDMDGTYELTFNSEVSWIATIWKALDELPQEYTESDEWDEVTTAMAWIQQRLGVENKMDYEQADDGDNCWDCGEPNDEANMNMCNECRHTICWDCQGGINSSYSSPHRDGRLADKLPCGNTTRILHL